MNGISGAADFSALCSSFHTVFLDHIPVLPLSSKHNEARRFVTLIDEAYLAHIRLVWSAEKAPTELFQMLTSIKKEEEEDPTIGSKSSSSSLWHGDGTSNTNVYARNFEQGHLMILVALFTERRVFICLHNISFSASCMNRMCVFRRLCTSGFGGGRLALLAG